MKRNGFTLVETLVVVGILGILASIAIPMTINSINRSKQGKTIEDIRAIATAWEARAAEVRAYNAAGAKYQIPARTLTAAQLSSLLSPTYMKVLPTTDGWGNALDFRTDFRIGAKTASMTYSIRAPGRDGKWQSTGRSSYTIGTTTKFDCDIVYSNGTFIAYPQGVQK